MSLLEQQIRELKLKQAKAELLKFFFSAIETTPLSDGQKEVSEEVISDIRSFFTGRIESIEEGKAFVAQESESETFSQDEVQILKVLAARAQGRSETAPVRTEATKGAFANDDEEPPRPTPVKNDPMKDLKKDKIRFALANRHLDQKRVTVNSKQGKVKGTVVGIDAPHIIVKTDTGHTIPVDIESLIVE